MNLPTKTSDKINLAWFRKLAGQFSDFPGYDGYEIAQVELEQDVTEDYPDREGKKRDHYAVLSASQKGKVMTMKLIRPKEKIKRTENTISNVPGQWSWSAEDIENFTKEVGDTNSIHHGENAIVPGLLMLETLLLELQACEISWKKIKMRFYEPIFASQTVQIDRQEAVYTASVKEEQSCWKMWLS